MTRPTSYSGSTPPSGIASGLASLPNGLPSNPTRFCDLPYTDILLSSPGNPIVLVPLLFFHRRAHGPFVHCLAVTVAVRTDHVPNVYIVALVRYLALISTSCHYGLGKPYFVFFTHTNITCHYGLDHHAFDFTSASCDPPPPTSSSPPPPLSPSVTSSPVSVTLGRDLPQDRPYRNSWQLWLRLQKV